MAYDPLFDQKFCSRCSNELIARIMSWFNNDIICMDCSAKEDKIKAALREAGKGDMEGCGFVPNVELPEEK